MILQKIKKNLPLVVFCLFLIVGLSIYLNSFGNEFFWDDDDSVVNNTYIKNWKNSPKFFSENLIAGAGQTTNYWRPLLLVSFSFDYHLWGLEPIGFHFTNTILHIFCAWLAFIFLYSIASLRTKRNDDNKNFWLAFLPALFFLIHPLQTEAVTYMAGRADPLSSVFFLLVLIFYINLRKTKKIFWLFFSLLFFVFGLLTKETIIFLPFILLLIETVFFFKKAEWKKSIKFLSLFFALSILYFVLRITVLNFNDILGGVNNVNNFYEGLGYAGRFFIFFKVILLFLFLIFFPFGLHMEREIAPVASFFSWPVVLFIILMAIIAIICFKTWKKNKLITFGWLWFFIILLPRTNIIAINRPMYEHWLYLPLIGFYLAIFSFIFLTPDYLKNKKIFWTRTFFCGIIIFYLVFLSFLTVKRNFDWRDPITFYEKNLLYSPNSFIQRNNLGMAYAEDGRHEEAIAEYKKSIAIKDYYPQVHSNMANSLAVIGQFAEAEEEYWRAIEMNPEFLLAYRGLYNLYVYQNKKEEAEEILIKLKNIK